MIAMILTMTLLVAMMVTVTYDDCDEEVGDDNCDDFSDSDDLGDYYGDGYDGFNDFII